MPQFNLEGGILAPISDGTQPLKAKGKAAKASGKAKPKAKPLAKALDKEVTDKENLSPEEQVGVTYGLVRQRAVVGLRVDGQKGSSVASGRVDCNYSVGCQAWSATVTTVRLRT